MLYINCKTLMNILNFIFIRYLLYQRPTYIHTYIHAYIHTYIYTYIRTCMHTSKANLAFHPGQTDGGLAYSEREREFTYATNCA